MGLKGTINKSGAVCGLVLSALLTPSSGWAAPVYTLTDLGDLPGGNNLSQARGINDSGQVVGYSYASTGARGFIWDSVNGMVDLGDLPGGTDISIAHDINDSGQAVGYSGTTGGNSAVLWDSGTMFDLNDLLDASGVGWRLQEATGINSYGDIIGYGTRQDGVMHAFLLTAVPDTAVVPVPAAAPMVLLGMGLIGLVRRSRRSKDKL